MEIDGITILRLEAGTVEDVKNVLNEIIEKNIRRVAFTELNSDNKRKRLWNVLLHHLDKPSSSLCHKNCLTTVRILSREKTDIDKIISEKWVELLLSHAGLSRQEHMEHHLDWHNLEDEQCDIMVESLKAMCNLMLSGDKIRSIFNKNKCVDQIVTRLRLFKEPDIPHEIKFNDIRLLFILTATYSDIKVRLKEELHGFTYLMEALDLIISEASVDEKSTVVLNENQVALVVEVLKVLFNILVKPSHLNFDEQDDAHFMRLEVILKNLLLCGTAVPTDITVLRDNVVNLLITAPNSCHKELMTPVTSEDPLRGMEFEGKNMEVVFILIDILDKKLKNFFEPENSDTYPYTLSPVLTVLIECARADSVLRRFIRLQILPPLKDVTTRPEEGEKLRNKLCRLLTSSNTNVRDLSAELLFVLCKKNVARMIKYTGYGNAAGMFACRGLLSRTRQASGEFSSNSEDSDTEEYNQFKDKINPVIGCYEPPRPDPMAAMSEEQKEYEAIKLVNMMDKLARQGLVQPCKIDENGRPQPVDHIMQLQDELPRQQRDGKSDSDDEN